MILQWLVAINHVLPYVSGDEVLGSALPREPEVDCTILVCCCSGTPSSPASPVLPSNKKDADITTGS